MARFWADSFVISNTHDSIRKEVFKLFGVYKQVGIARSIENSAESGNDACTRILDTLIFIRLPHSLHAAYVRLSVT